MLLALLFATKASACEFELIGDSAGLVVAPGSDVNKLANMLPGETREIEIHIENKGDEPYKLYMKVVDLNPDKSNPSSLMDPDKLVSNGPFAQSASHPLQLRIFLDDRQLASFPSDRSGYTDSPSIEGYTLLGMMPARARALLKAQAMFLGGAADQGASQGNEARFKLSFVAEYADPAPSATPRPTSAPDRGPSWRPPSSSGTNTEATAGAPQSPGSAPASERPQERPAPYHPELNPIPALGESVYVDLDSPPEGAPVLRNETPPPPPKSMPATGEAPLWPMMFSGFAAAAAGILIMAAGRRKRRVK
jgi:hypothetical protein